MMINIIQIQSPETKSEICQTILHALPGWFGIEESITEYAEDSRNMCFFAAYSERTPIGFLALKEHNEYTSEIYVTGILQKFQHQGIGKSLVHCAQKFCTDHSAKAEFLTVKTLAASHPSKAYEKTRGFYQALGFKPLEVFSDLWDKGNPCLFLAKYLGE